jgi:hypothetical protein
MGPFSKPAAPPAMAEFISTLQPAASGSNPQQTAYRLFRSSDGKTRVDAGAVSVIHDPSAGRSIVLDHVKKEARILPAAPQTPGMPPVPQVSGAPMPAMPQLPALHVQELGKSVFQGQHVEGRRYTFHPPAAPQLQMPRMPHTPQTPATVEVWTRPDLQLPVATRLQGSAMQQTSICQKVVPGEPHPAVFQIPHDYKQVLPTR